MPRLPDCTCHIKAKVLDVDNIVWSSSESGTKVESIKLKFEVLKMLNPLKAGRINQGVCEGEYWPERVITTVIMANSLSFDTKLLKPGAIIKGNIRYQKDDYGDWHYLNKIKLISERGESK